MYYVCIIYTYIYIYIISLSLSIHLSIYLSLSIYIYRCNLPPLIITPQIKQNKPFGGFLFNHQFRRRHDYPLINDDFWFDLHPS